MNKRTNVIVSLLALCAWLAPAMPAWAESSPDATDAAPDAAKVQAATQAETAEEAVQMATEEVLALIQAGQAYAEEDPERIYVEVEALLAPLIDFPRFARNVMGAYGRGASDEQRDRFAESFKWSLVRTYSLALTEFHEGEVNVLPPRKPPRDPSKVNVMQEIKYQGKVYQVVYLMRRGDAGWRVRNMIIEGVNIGLNYKSQFAAAMKDPENDGDLDRVIDAWSDFVASAETAES